MAFKRVTLNELKKDGNPCEEYRDFIQKQLNALTRIWDKLIMEEKEFQDFKETKFSSFPSYDIRVHFRFLLSYAKTSIIAQ